MLSDIANPYAEVQDHPENLWNCDEKGIIMGLAIGRQKAQ